MRRFSVLVAKARREIGHPSPLVRRRLADMAEAHRYILTALGQRSTAGTPSGEPCRAGSAG